MGEVIYEKVLTVGKLQGRKDCEIRFVRHDGNFADISLQAFKRNITLAPMTRRLFEAEVKRKK